MKTNKKREKQHKKQLKETVARADTENVKKRDKKRSKTKLEKNAHRVFFELSVWSKVSTRQKLSGSDQH